MSKYEVFFIGQILSALFLGVLFLQSSLDKIFNYQGNLSYFKDHFNNSPLRNTVSLLLPTITLLELTSGILSCVGALMIVIDNDRTIAFWGCAFAGLSITALFFGQRLAKDYAGAVSLASYFGIVLVSFILYAL
jgi:hypothetical protein